MCLSGLCLMNGKILPSHQSNIVCSIKRRITIIRMTFLSDQFAPICTFMLSQTVEWKLVIEFIINIVTRWNSIPWFKQVRRWTPWNPRVLCIVKYHHDQFAVVALSSNITYEQNTSNTHLTNKAYPGYCKHVLCWMPPEKALDYLAGNLRH